MNPHVASLFAAVLLFAPTSIDRSPIADPIPAEQFQVTIGKHQLVDLVDAAAKFLDINVLWTREDRDGNAAAMQTEISKPLSLDRADCEDFIGDLLMRHNLALVATNSKLSLYEVINMMGPRRSVIVDRATFMAPSEVVARPSSWRFVITVVPLQHLKSNGAVSALRPFFTTPGASQPLSIGNVGSDSVVILQGIAHVVANAIRTLEIAERAAAVEVEQQVQAVPHIMELAARIERLEALVANQAGPDGEKGESRQKD